MFSFSFMSWWTWLCIRQLWSQPKLKAKFVFPDQVNEGRKVSDILKSQQHIKKNTKKAFSQPTLNFKFKLKL